MSAQIDVAGPIRVILRRAEREFDQKILELANPDEREALVVKQEAPGAYQLGALSEAFRQAMQSFARAFAQGQEDFRRANRG